MKLKKWISSVLCLVMVAALLAACGGSSAAKSTYNESAYEAYDVEAPAMAESAIAENGSSGSGDASIKLPQGRKWIVTVNLSAETEDLDGMLTALNRKISELAGYIESQDIRNGSSYSSSRRYRSANLTVRIPVEKLTDFTETVKGISNVTSNSQNAQDVTLNYVDTESRLAALKIEEERLLDLLSRAESMADILEIESRLTDLRFEVERYGSKLRTMDNQIDFATIYLDVSEVKEYTPVAEPTFFERISTGFVASLKDLGDTLLDIAAWLIIGLPYFAALAILIALIVIVCRKVSKKSKERRMKKAEKEAAIAAERWKQAQAAQKAAQAEQGAEQAPEKEGE